MHTQQLTVNQQDRSHEVERSEEAAIAGEISRRLLDMREASSATRTRSFISKLHALSQLDTEALWVVLSLMTGDLTEITRSYQDIAKEHALDKQAVQQRLERVIISVRRHYPQLAEAIIHLRHITADTGQRQNVA